MLGASIHSSIRLSAPVSLAVIIFFNPGKAPVDTYDHVCAFVCRFVPSSHRERRRDGTNADVWRRHGRFGSTFRSQSEILISPVTPFRRSPGFRVSAAEVTRRAFPGSRPV